MKKLLEKKKTIAAIVVSILVALDVTIGANLSQEILEILGILTDSVETLTVDE
jgi:hypothetical protein